MSIRKKVMLAIVLAVVLSIVGVSLMVSIQMRSTFVGNYEVSSRAQLQRLESFVDLFFDNALANAELLADSPLVLEQLPHMTSYAGSKQPIKPVGEDLPEGERGLYRELTRLTKAFPSYALVYVGNAKGGFTQAPDDTLTAGYNPPERDWYIDTMKAKKAIITEAYLSDNGEAVCTVTAPVRGGRSGVFDGVVGFDIELVTLTAETGNVKVGETGYVLMLDAVGQVISDPGNSGPDTPEKERWLGKTLDQLPADASTSMAALRTLGSGVTEVSFGGKDWLAGVQTTRAGWSLIMLQEKDEVFADAMRVALGIFVVGLGIALVMAVIAWLIARSISGPVSRLAEASHAVADGDLDAIPSDERPFKGELGLLHASLKRMVATLGELIATANAKMKEAEEALAASKLSLAEAEEAKKAADQARRQGVLQTAEQIGGILMPLSAATSRLSGEAGEMARGAARQQEIVDGTAQGIRQMNEAVGEVASATSRTARLAEDAQDRARDGRSLVMDVVANMGKIQEQSLAMSQGLASLGGQVADISQIMGVINDIADQTNLLALNAAIEAARAGDAGRGFAVVADEVRKLAEKTMEATRQVSTAITTIQQGTDNNVKAMQEAAAFIGEATEVANQAGEALGHIEDMVEKTAGEVRSIATASEEQSASTEEINRSTENIKQISDTVAHSAERSNDAVAELVSLSQKLDQLVNDLRKE